MLMKDVCKMDKYVAYLRVSTQKQGESGLGLQAQKEAVEMYAKRQGCDIIATFTETESGRKSNKGRPQLQAALERVKISNSQLLIARLDRLTRSVSFLCKLRDERVDFVAVDMPQANKLTINVLASVAEYEADRISLNTSLALKAAKTKNPTLKLGNPMGTKAFGLSFYEGSRKGGLSTRRKAIAYASDLRGEIDGLRRGGITSIAAIANALNERNIVTSTKGQWHPTSVARVLARLETIKST
jgi:DNA invertase Pin-like site-specific DNA recombinase